MEREDYIGTVKTQIDGELVHVSQGEIDTKYACLIQVGTEGNYATAYLSDYQVNVLIRTLAGYLEAQ